MTWQGRPGKGGHKDKQITDVAEAAESQREKQLLSSWLGI